MVEAFPRVRRWDIRRNLQLPDRTPKPVARYASRLFKLRLNEFCHFSQTKRGSAPRLRNCAATRAPVRAGEEFHEARIVARVAGCQSNITPKLVEYCRVFDSFAPPLLGWRPAPSCRSGPAVLHSGGAPKVFGVHIDACSFSVLRNEESLPYLLR